MSKRRPTSFRSWAWRVAISLALLSALATGAVIAVREGALRDTLRRWLEQVGGEALGAELRIGALEGRLLPNLRLRDVELRTGERTLLLARELDLRVDLDPLLAGEAIAVRELTLRGVQLQLWRDENEAWNVEALVPPESDASEQDSELALLVDQLRLEDAQVEIDDGEQPTRIQITASLEHIRLPFDPGAAASLRGSVRLTPEGQQTAELTLEDGLAKLAPYAFEIANGRASLEGEANVADWLDPDHAAAARIRADASGVDPAAVPAMDWPEGVVSGRISVDLLRRESEVTSSFELALGPSRLLSLELERATARGSTYGESWILDELVAEGPSLHALAHGRGMAAAIDQFALTLRVDDLASVSQLVSVPLSGRLELEAKLAGPVDGLRGRVTAKGASLRLGELALGELELRARAPAPEQFVVEAFALSGGDLELTLAAPADLRFADGRLEVSGLELHSGPVESLRLAGQFHEGMLANVRIRASGIDASALAHLAGLELEPGGSGSLELALSGPLERPLGNGQLEWRSPHFGELSLDALRGEVLAKDGRLAIELRAFDEGATSPLFELDANAEWSLGVPLAGLHERHATTAHLRTRGLELARIAELLPEALRATTGSVALDIAARGNDASPDLEGWLELTSDPIEWLRIEGASRNAVLVDVRVRASGIDPSALARLTDLDLEIEPGGSGSLELALSGPLDRPLGTGQLEWRSPHFGEVSLDSLRGEVSAEQGRIALELRAFDEGASSPLFEVDAQAPWSSAIPLTALLEHSETAAHLHVRQLTIARVAQLLPGPLRSASGSLTLDLAVHGSDDGSSVEGRLGLSNGSLAVPLARQLFEPIEAQLVLRDGRVDIEQLSAGPPGAQARITGSVGLDGVQIARSDLQADLEQFEIARSSLLKAKASGQLTLVGPIDALVLEGDLRLDGVRASLPDEQDRELREIQVLAASGRDDDRSEFVERDSEPDAFDRSTVRISLQVPPGSRVRGRGAELDLQGDLLLERRPLDPMRLSGEARVVRGHILFQRKRFALERGIVQFDGSADPRDPVVDIIGVHRVREVSVILHATGRVSDPPRIELSGDPPMSADEALAYLLFGRPVDELRESERGSVQSAAASLAASVALDEFARLVTQAGIVDTLEFDFAEDGSAGALRVGSYIGNDTFVRVGNTFGSETEQDVHVEYRLTPYLSVESEMSTTGNAGADLILRLDY